MSTTITSGTYTYDNMDTINLGPIGATNSIIQTTTTAPITPGLTWGTATNGQYVLTTSGTSGPNWGDLTITPHTTPNSLDVKGDANFDGDVKLKGKSLSDTLNKIEERLAILHPNEALEEKWEQLKELGKQYREMEKDILEKEKIWKILNR